MGDEKAADLRRKRRPIDGREEVVATPDAPEFHSTAAARGEGLTVGCRHRRIVCAQDDQRGTAAEVSHRAKTISGRVLPASEPAEALAKDARARWVVSEDAAKSREGRDRHGANDPGMTRGGHERQRAPGGETSRPDVEAPLGKPPRRSCQIVWPREEARPTCRGAEPALLDRGHGDASRRQALMEIVEHMGAAPTVGKSHTNAVRPTGQEEATSQEDRLVAQVHREHHARWAAFAPGVAFRNFSNR